MTSLSARLTPCGPVIDAAAVAVLRAQLSEAADADGWRADLDVAWPALAPAFSAAPYLAGLARRRPERLREVLAGDPEATLAGLIRAAENLASVEEAQAGPGLRALKARLHLLTALADLGRVWNADRATRALSDFADAAVRTALAVAAAGQRARGKLLAPADHPRGPVPGLFGLAMGKHGAHELNYSSDIDISLFWEPEAMAAAVAAGADPQTLADRIAQAMTRLLSERTAEGYVFRVDLRLRPDPATTPPVVATPVALAYYESVGQNWERAAFIKARAVCGDAGAAADFLRELTPSSGVAASTTRRWPTSMRSNARSMCTRPAKV